MLKTIILLSGVCFLLPSCSVSPTSSSRADARAWQTIPPWAQKRIQQDWWSQYGDATLNKDINRALANNPGLAVISARLERADAVVSQARAASLPSLNLGIGHRSGRKQEVDFGPYNLAPWEGNGQFSWEVDVTGRLRAATKSAKAARDAAFWDMYAARLLLTSRVAATRFNLYRFNTELVLMRQSIEASRKILNAMRSQNDAGIITAAQLHEQRAEHEQIKRQLLDLERLRKLSVIQLSTLLGGGPVSDTYRSQLPSPSSPRSLSPQELLVANPALLAAEARVRSAFQMQKASKLHLLPSFRLTASAMGAGNSLTRRYKVWRHHVGPVLDLPIYDPSRLAAVKTRQAECKIASAQYRETVLKVLAEVDSSHINYTSRHRQLSTAQRTVASLAESRRLAKARLNAGITSDIEYYRADRRWLDARRAEVSLQQQLLNNHILFIKATGGGA